MENLKRVMKSAADAAPITIQNLKSLPKFEVKADFYEVVLEQYFQRFAGARVRQAASTSTDDIRRLLLAAQQDGLNEQSILAAGLKAKGLSAFRADTIARTETHNAASYASRAVADDIAREVGATMEKAWAAVRDERTRPAHAAMSATDYIPMDEAFDVDGEALDTPGDPSASPENTINCRCVEVRRFI